MKKYNVCVSLMVGGTLEIEAENEEDAESIVNNMSNDEIVDEFGGKLFLEVHNVEEVKE